MRTAILTVVVLAALVAPSAAAACSVASPPPTPKERVRAADRAVWGEVVSKEPVDEQADDGRPGQEFRYRFRVIETYKGSIRKTLRLVAGTESSLCEPGELHVGQRFGLVLNKRRGPWRISITSFISRKDLRSVRKPRRA